MTAVIVLNALKSCDCAICLPACQTKKKVFRAFVCANACTNFLHMCFTAQRLLPCSVALQVYPYADHCLEYRYLPSLSF